MEGQKRRLINPAFFSGSIADLLHPPASQIPFLDGLRTIAVLLVIGQHFSGKFAAAYGSNFYSRLPFVINGWMGVDLFFVLSGFFIGGQLWKELRESKSIAVGRFVIRRGFRIWPLYFFVFLCVLAFLVITGHAAAKEYGWSDIFFITNFHNRGVVDGSWSLCTEEQFYIVTPLVLFFCARRVRSIAGYRPWLWGLLFFFPLLRAAIWIHETGSLFKHSPTLFAPLYYASITHCDGLIMGLIISNYWVTRDRPALRLATPGALIVASVALMIALHQLQKEIFDFTVLALLFGSFVWLGIQRGPRIFNSRFFYWGSRLSFGMYLNHEYMCPWLVREFHSHVPPFAHFPTLANMFGFVLIAMLSAGLSLVTFCWVEHPFLEMRKVVLKKRTEHSVIRKSMLHEPQVQPQVQEPT